MTFQKFSTKFLCQEKKIWNSPTLKECPLNGQGWLTEEVATFYIFIYTLQLFTLSLVVEMGIMSHRNGNPLQCSCLENPRDGGACWAAVCGVGHDWSDLAAAPVTNFSHGHNVFEYIIVHPSHTPRKSLLRHRLLQFVKIQFGSFQSLNHVRLCNPMNRSMPNLPVHHQLPEFTETHVHWVSDYQLLKLRIQIYLSHKKWMWYSYFRGSWLEDFIPHSNFWQSIKWCYFSWMNKTLNLL